MSYKVVAIFEVVPGMTEEELRRTRLALEILQQQQGFLSYESVRTDEGNVMVIQGWQSKQDYQRAIALARQQRAAAADAPTVTSRVFHAGDLEFSV